MSADVAPGPVLGAGRVVAPGTGAGPRWTPGDVLRVGVHAVSFSLVNGFVLASLQGAVGVVGREQTLLRMWVWSTVLLAPGYALLVVAVLRRVARRTRGRRPLAGVVALAAAGVLAGCAATAAVAAWDVHVQDGQIAAVASTHLEHATGATGVTSGCDAVCRVKQQTLRTHVKSVVLAAPVVLVADLVLAGWLLAAFGGEVTVPAARRRRSLDLSEMVGPA